MNFKMIVTMPSIIKFKFSNFIKKPNLSGRYIKRPFTNLTGEWINEKQFPIICFLLLVNLSVSTIKTCMF